MSNQDPSTTDLSKTQAIQRNWEREVLERLAFSALKEQRRARRWSIFFKLLFAAYLLVLLLLYLPNGLSAPGIITPHTALVKIEGIIGSDSFANAENIKKGLKAAFENEHIAGLILHINSPGGSPVQANQINDQIHQLRKEHPNIPIHAVITDICASGGYYIAVAADQIYADKASIVGSIGALINSFGFVEAMEKLGIERRLFTAGDYKGFLDPFSPMKEFESQHIQKMLDNIHKQFIQVVKDNRGERLKNDSSLFSGLVWTGEQAIDLGLIDGLGNSNYVAREIIGAEKIVDYTPQPKLLDRFSRQLGATFANMLSGFTLAANTR
ncbi:Peptidase S49, SppA [Nitrosococcus oceani ATCC 19707]|uniref:Peptidase S49, SppA n=2 Tax=Nitrosococcus oceani TaxID=1229 RepID=Q3J7A5_NITOC|nr:signal peptide peptidase SppA [Nitrosococcus oceani]ABA59291.1 Peptidase S49, SppA [Nitrosococcus oceani ATCC 19707]EDZ65867.1 peptidase, S49 (protease IV) family [Nitrosococcus oceani AFC27]KFI18319.1 peptidase S49 [Nitrosococcus oceani C-27]GEM21117.1 signal peptide peptidase SppA [Nitrosococcus oceani]